MRIFVEKDWRIHEFSDFMNQNNCTLSYSLSENSIKGCGFPRQKRWKEDRPVTFDNEKPHLWFDNFANIEKIQFNDLEIMQYSDLDVFKLYNHPPVIAALKEKSGAPQELSFKREIYPVHDLIQLRADLTQNEIQSEITTREEKKTKSKASHSRRKKTENEDEKSTNYSEKELDEIWGLKQKLEIESYSDEKLDQNFDDFDEHVIETSIPGVILDLFGEVPEQGNTIVQTSEKSTKKSVNLFDKMEGIGVIVSPSADLFVFGRL